MPALDKLHLDHIAIWQTVAALEFGILTEPSPNTLYRRAPEEFEPLKKPRTERPNEPIVEP